jgi:hypothetical protein
MSEWVGHGRQGIVQASKAIDVASIIDDRDAFENYRMFKPIVGMLINNCSRVEWTGVGNQEGYRKQKEKRKAVVVRQAKRDAVAETGSGDEDEEEPPVNNAGAQHGAGAHAKKVKKKWLVHAGSNARIMNLGRTGKPVSKNRSELDSHTDTSCGGVNTVVPALTGETVNVSPFSGEYSPMNNFPTATIGTMWEDNFTNEPVFIFIHEALYFGKKLRDSLLCPNQLHANGLKVEEVSQ